MNAQSIEEQSMEQYRKDFESIFLSSKNIKIQNKIG